MIAKLAENTACFFVDRNIIRSDEKDIYAYGMELLISAVLNTLLILLLAILTRTIIPTAVFTVVFLTLRKYLGGYHARTHLGCLGILLCVMTGVYIAYMAVPSFLYRGIMFCTTLIGMMSIEIYAPVRHPNKPVSAKLATELKAGGMIACAVFAASEIILSICGQDKIAFCVALGITASVCAMLAQKKENDMRMEE